MKKIKFALIGWGWRAKFYYRIAKLIPEQFELTGVLCRSRENGEAIEAEFGVKSVYSLDELMADAPSFVVLCIKRGHVSNYLKDLFADGIAVLSETPPPESVDELVCLWEKYLSTKAKVQVAEQYLFQPLYSAWDKAISDGLIGDVQNVSISSLHGYHGVSVIRRFLDAGFGACSIYGKRYSFKLTETFGRGGAVFDGEISDSTRDRLTFEFSNGKVAFFDFSDPAQYHSFIRTRQLNVQGHRGEIDDLTIRYLTDDNIPITQTLTRVDMGVYNNQEWAHSGIFLGERQLYTNPFKHARLNDDEIAVATCLARMELYLETGEDFYSLRCALQDTYLSLLMNRALESPNIPIASEIMPWA